MSDTAQEGYVTLAKQTAQGTPATTVTTGVRVTSATIGVDTSNVEADPEIGGGRDRDTAGVELGSYFTGGSLEGYCRYDALGFLLLAAGFVEQGAPVQDGTTGAYTHTFVPGDPSYLTIEHSWGKSRIVRRMSDVLVDELEFAVGGDELATFKASLLGLKETRQASASVPVYAALDQIGSYRGSAVTLDSLSTYRFADIALTIGNNGEADDPVIGQRERADITLKRRDVGFSGTMKYNPAAPTAIADLYRAASYGSKTADSPGADGPFHTSATVRIGSTRKIGTSTTLMYGIEATLPDVVLDAFELPSSGDDVIEASIVGKAYKGTNPVSTIKIFNARATAY